MPRKETEGRSVQETLVDRASKLSGERVQVSLKVGTSTRKRIDILSAALGMQKGHVLDLAVEDLFKSNIESVVKEIDEA